MSNSVILVENLSKRYLVGHQSSRGERYHALRDVISREVKSFLRNAVNLVRGNQIIPGDEIEEFWALKDVSFEIKRGEVRGIIGRNGAGKSTLLKVISRITEPTKGRVRIRGRAASLLEVGTGFHPELSGRDNIFLNGAILGMTRADIREKFDEIVAFAEVEKFLDTPVKRYSSGMYLRLAFAVAAHLEPEILIVDEVLAVGDAGFQKKCLGKIDEVSRREGRTVLFVSHNMGVMTTLCPSVIWLDNGSVRKAGPTRPIVNEYLIQGIADQSQLLKLDQFSRHEDLGTRLRLISLEWLCALPLQHGQRLRARMTFETFSPVSEISIGIGFSALEGGRLLSYDMDFQDGFRPSISKPGIYHVEIDVPSLPLGPDMYNLDVGCRSGDFHGLDYVGSATQLEVVPGPTTQGTIVRKGAGVRLESQWTWLS